MENITTTIQDIKATFPNAVLILDTICTQGCETIVKVYLYHTQVDADFDINKSKSFGNFLAIV